MPLGPDLEYDADALIARRGASAGASVTIVCSPNNPTGGVLRAATRWRACARTATAWWWSTRRTTSSPGSRWCRCWPSTRTWSCCARSPRPWPWPACASATCWPRPSWCARSNKARLPYNLNFFSQAAALAVLEEPGALEANVARLVRGARGAVRATWPRMPGVRAYPVARELHPVRARGPRPARPCSSRSTRGACWCAT